MAHTARAPSPASAVRVSAAVTVVASSRAARRQMPAAIGSVAARLRHRVRERRDDPHPVLGRLQVDVGALEVGPPLAHDLGQGRRLAAPVVRAHHRIQSLAADPVAAAGVAHDVAPAVDARDAVPPDAEGHDARAGRDDGPADIAERSEERRDGVVGEHRLTGAGRAHQREQLPRVALAVGQPGDARRDDIRMRAGLLGDPQRDLRELRQQRLVRADAGEEEVEVRPARCR